MDIKGFIDISFVDWDGKVSSVIFLPKCNFRCPFCHNRNLVLKPETIETIPFENLEEQLTIQKNWIDGVCITGGEPTLHSDLPDLCSKIKKMNFLVKLDTNGTNPKMLKKLIDKKLVDYIAMDVKAPLTVEKYSKAIGVNAKTLFENVKKSINLLKTSDIDYEFRTTVVPTIHETDDIVQICDALKGSKKYVLQKFDVNIGQVVLDPSFNTKTLPEDVMQKFVACARKIIPSTKVRGTEEK
ncbi:MAG: anaerobic ribonucleoside-triphosphate reductase activating protein [Candidatus Bathyarchaeota archaeon]|nr:MAG: anaerobic ribonucleoside-triphosphate reductase activating protein [Candidatus Bathyarchaeota archaeon]